MILNVIILVTKAWIQYLTRFQLFLQQQKHFNNLHLPG